MRNIKYFYSVVFISLNFENNIFFFHKGSERYINVKKKKGKKENKLPLLGFEPTLLNLNVVDK
jgi:hypothetical protein